MMLHRYLEGGIVKATWDGTTVYALWVDCPVHGREAPFIDGGTTLPWRDDPGNTCDLHYTTGPFVRPQRALAACGVAGPLVNINITQKAKRKRTAPRRCDTRCLNGTKECSCHCKGRDHGVGVCSCIPSAKL